MSHEYLIQHSLKLGGTNYHFKWVQVPVLMLLSNLSFFLFYYKMKYCEVIDSNFRRFEEFFKNFVDMLLSVYTHIVKKYWVNFILYPRKLVYHE